jgi:hypothetical protein
MAWQNVPASPPTGITACSRRAELMILCARIGFNP